MTCLVADFVMFRKTLLFYNILVFIGFDAAFSSETCKGDICEDSLSMPLLDKMDAALKAEVDMSKLNKHLHAYIKQEIQKSVRNEITKMLNNKVEETKVCMRASLDQKFKGYGSSYIRWGRSQCSGSDTELVYSGYAAGNIYYDGTSTTRFGGASNMLCLPNNPELSNNTVPGSSLLHGSEFQEKNFGAHSLDEDVPCALCRSRNSTTSVMIPGRRTCYGGWKTEYNGRLASGCSACRASSYICVDMNPEYIPGGERNNNHNLLYTTGTKCGSLPCPPYHDNLEIYCVVCTK